MRLQIAGDAAPQESDGGAVAMLTGNCRPEVAIVSNGDRSYSPAE
jgi:hypothetical protein